MKPIFKDFQIHIFSLCVKILVSQIVFTNRAQKLVSFGGIILYVQIPIYAQFCDFNAHAGKKISAT